MGQITSKKVRLHMAQPQQGTKSESMGHSVSRITLVDKKNQVFSSSWTTAYRRPWVFVQFLMFFVGVGGWGMGGLIAFCGFHSSGLST